MEITEARRQELLTLATFAEKDSRPLPKFLKKDEKQIIIHPHKLLKKRTFKLRKEPQRPRKQRPFDWTLRNERYKKRNKSILLPGMPRRAKCTL